MTIHIALLRGVNVGGNQMVAMADLRGLLESLGFTEVRSLLQSGNLVFDSADRTGADLQTLLETVVHENLGLRTDIFVRSLEAWRALIAANPFPEFAEADPGHLLTVFLKDAPDKKDVGALRAAITGPEIVRAESRQLYACYPDGIGRSKLTNGLIEKKLGTRVTGRNWNTVLKLGAMAEGEAEAPEA
jgi:uncharacterized protein (DUF1697 family)